MLMRVIMGVSIAFRHSSHLTQIFPTQEAGEDRALSLHCLSAFISSHTKAPKSPKCVELQTVSIAFRHSSHLTPPGKVRGLVESAEVSIAFRHSSHLTLIPWAKIWVGSHGVVSIAFRHSSHLTLPGTTINIMFLVMSPLPFGIHLISHVSADLERVIQQLIGLHCLSAFISSHTRKSWRMEYQVTVISLHCLSAFISSHTRLSRQQVLSRTRESPLPFGIHLISHRHTRSL